MSHDVFINNSTAGKLTAYAICNELESIGIRCWILPRDINVGIAWDQSVANAIKSCRIMIVVLADYAGRSDRVERQLELAFDNELIVIPFRTSSAEGESHPAVDSAHWLDAVTPEVAERLRSLCNLVRGLILRRNDNPLLARPSTVGPEEIARPAVGGFPELPAGDTVKEPAGTPPTQAVAEPPITDLERSSVPVLESVDESESPAMKPVLRQPKKGSKWFPIRVLLLTLLPFAIICALGVWQMKKAHKPKPPIPIKASIPATAPSVTVSMPTTAPSVAVPIPVKAPPVVKIQHQEKFDASNPAWGTLDANWAITDGKLQVTPLLNSSAVLINHDKEFTDAEVTAEVVMSKGEDLDQLGGLIFWAKDYNDCYALVISADGKFAVGRKLVGRWINPIAKTDTAAIRTGVGETNKLRIRTEGNVLTASINDTQVATLTADPPQGSSCIGLYGESAETTQNVWDFTDVTVTTVLPQK
jgi:TIR domain